MGDIGKEFFGILSMIVLVALVIGLVVYHTGTTQVVGAGSQAFNSALSVATFQNAGMGGLGGLGSAGGPLNLTGFGG